MDSNWGRSARVIVVALACALMAGAEEAVPTLPAGVVAAMQGGRYVEVIAAIDVAITEAKDASDRSYLASWALASYLAFDRRLLGTASLDAFVYSVNRDGEPKEAFAKLTGQKIEEFEKDLHLRAAYDENT